MSSLSSSSSEAEYISFKDSVSGDHSSSVAATLTNSSGSSVTISDGAGGASLTGTAKTAVGGEGEREAHELVLLNGSDTATPSSDADEESIEAAKLRKQLRRQKRLMTQLYMSDSEFEVDEDEVNSTSRSFRRKAKIDYNENKKLPTHQVVVGSRGLSERKRGRPAHKVKPSKVGRPRKGLSLPAAVSADTVITVHTIPDLSTPPVAKRKRGRPPKRRRLELEAPAVPVKRRPGRPRLDKVTEATTLGSSIAGDVKIEMDHNAITDFQRQLLEDTDPLFLEKLAKSDLASRWQTISEKLNSSNGKKVQEEDKKQRSNGELVDLSFLDADNMDELNGYQNLISDQYYKLAKQFKEAQVTRIDELIKVIDTSVGKVKLDYTKYKRRLDGAKEKYESMKERKGSGESLLEGVERIRLPNRVQKILFPSVFDSVLSSRYEKLRQLKLHALHQLEMIDNQEKANGGIIKRRFDTSVRENRENIRQQILEDLETLNKQFVTTTGIKIRPSEENDEFGTEEEPGHAEGLDLGREHAEELDLVREHLAENGQNIDLNTLEGLAEVSELSSQLRKKRRRRRV